MTRRDEHVASLCGVQELLCQTGKPEHDNPIQLGNKRSAMNTETCSFLYAENLIPMQVFGKHSATTASIPLPTVMKLPVWMKDKMPREQNN